jgi:dTDP-glucose 4,6-dehydratase
VDVVFHLAALIGIPYSYETPLAYIRTNVEGTYNVLEAARTEGVGRVVHLSTSEVYGTARYVPMDEEHPLQAQSPYAASKIAADQLALSYHRSFALPVVVVRPFNTYGPRQSARAVIPTIVTQALAGGPVRLGNLDPRRDFTFVRDTVAGIIAVGLCEQAVGQVVNLGSGRDVSVAELVDTVGRLLGRRPEVVVEDERRRAAGSEVERLLADTTKARDLTGWEPRYGLEDGLRETIAWFESNLDRYRPDRYAV